jgi:hypothetical protein
MNKYNDPEALKVPAFMRKAQLVSRSRQKLIMTALDRREAGQKKSPRRQAKHRHTTPSLRVEQKNSTAPKAPLIPKKAQLLEQTGTITHYLDKIDVAIIKLNKFLKSGDTLIIEGEEGLFYQPVAEIQIDRKPVIRAKKGDHVGMKVQFKAKVEGKIYKV